ncbi:hypothetical protein AVEN_133797-1 [Araneus ventricosus]|uniref:ATP-dependent DNA helicase n=1 Tax=Araneus ventricosus TaxID=182803 RepID=A0A4Y2L1Z6_ARAVE|nr:hypothetical protein AVEN_133797-1 [Araneus ventricosus]
MVETNKPRQTEDQRTAYEAVMNVISEEKGDILFLDAPGRTGKTFLINLMLAEIPSKRHIALAVASSEIASTLLDVGRTAHSALQLQLNLAQTENPVSKISKSSGKAAILQTCKLIVWDACTMSKKKAFEALDRTMRHLQNDNRIIGGVVILLSGDFLQTLPVISMATPSDELNAFFKASELWQYVQRITLTNNMRVHVLGDISYENFAKQLLSLGEGKLPTKYASDLFSIQSDFCVSIPSLKELIRHVFPVISNKYKDHHWLCERAILAPKNENVNKMNEIILQKLPENSITYKFVEAVMDKEQAVYYPTEFLNPPGMPPHMLNLKVGSSIMLLRNLDTPKLCNGTRLCVSKLMANVIQATILTGDKDESVFIPCIPIIPSDMPFEFKHFQFSVRLAFAITINKAQGQSLRVAGINLETPSFSHGQLLNVLGWGFQGICSYMLQTARLKMPFIRKL